MLGERDTSGVLWADDRGQTLQDYVLGLSLFLLTVTVVVGGALPSVLATFTEDASGAETSQAERVSEQIILNQSVPNTRNELNVTTLNETTSEDLSQLRTRYSIPKTSAINISVTTLDGSTIINPPSTDPLNTDSQPNVREVGTSARIITLSDGTCDPACRLIVRVW